MIHPDRYTCLGELLWDALIQYKSEVAHIEVSRRRELHQHTYLEFKQEVVRVARSLQQAGLKAGDRVAIVLSNQGRWLHAATAALYSGAVLVPIDYKLTTDEQQRLLTHANVTALFTEYGIWHQRETWAAHHIWVADAPGNGDLSPAKRWETMPSEGPAPQWVPRQRTDTATIVYSSGTGGTPKGCMLAHRAYLEQYKALLELYPMSPGDRYFSILPTNHAIDFMIGFIGPLCCGATVVHQRTLRPEMIIETLKRYKITHMAIVPMILNAFERSIQERLDTRPDWQQLAIDSLSSLNAHLTRKQAKHRLSRQLLKPIHDAFGGHLRMLFCGGAFVDQRRAEWFYRLGLPVVIGYGLTEACTVVTANDLKPFRADSVGRVIGDIQLRIANPDPNGIGEVQVTGPTVMLGYLDAPDLTANAFDGEWLKTGDLGYLDASHHLHLVGRNRNMIVTKGGKNIYPEDIEHNFSEVPCTEMAIYAADFIWPRQDQLEGEELIAVIRPEPDTTSDWLSTLKQYNYRLPDFKRLAGYVLWTGEFPRTASMKVKRHLLAEEVRAKTDRSTVQTLHR